MRCAGTDWNDFFRPANALMCWVIRHLGVQIQIANTQRAGTPSPHWQSGRPPSYVTALFSRLVTRHRAGHRSFVATIPSAGRTSGATLAVLFYRYNWTSLRARTFAWDRTPVDMAQVSRRHHRLDQRDDAPREKRFIFLRPSQSEPHGSRTRPFRLSVRRGWTRQSAHCSKIRTPTELTDSRLVTGINSLKEDFWFF